MKRNTRLERSIKSVGLKNDSILLMSLWNLTLNLVKTQLTHCKLRSREELELIEQVCSFYVEAGYF